MNVNAKQFSKMCGAITQLRVLSNRLESKIINEKKNIDHIKKVDNCGDNDPVVAVHKASVVELKSCKKSIDGILEELDG
jgi:hypothetical protein